MQQMRMRKGIHEMRSDEADEGGHGTRSDEDEGWEYMRCGQMRMRVYYTLCRTIASECDTCIVSEH